MSSFNKTIIGFTFLFSSVTARELRKHPDGQFVCTLTADKEKYQIGEIPKLQVQIINKSKKKVLFPGCLDGSEEKFRMPYCYFTIEKPVPDTIVFQACRTSNPIRPEDFVAVKSNESFDPYGKVDEAEFSPDFLTTQKLTFRNKGIYKICFHYSTALRDIMKYAGNLGIWVKGADSLKIKTLFRKVPHIELISNSIEFTIQ